MVDVLCRYRVIEPSLKHKILDGEELIDICERHFADEDTERTKTGQKALSQDVSKQYLQRTCQPAKSQDQPPKTERRELVRNEALNIDFQISNKHCYQKLDEFCRRVQCLQLTNWDININKDIVKLKQFISPYTIPYCDITIDVSLEFTIVVLGWPLPDTHSLYKCFFALLEMLPCQNC